MQEIKKLLKRKKAMNFQKAWRRRDIKKRVPIVILILLLFLGLVTVLFLFLKQAKAAGTTYYVDNCDVIGNDDTNDGASPSTPWLTINKVNASTFSAGDSILFRRGCTWTGTALNIQHSGSVGNLITFADYGTGEKPIIDADDLSGLAPIYSITAGLHDIKVQNLEPRNSTVGDSCIVFIVLPAGTGVMNRIYIDSIDITDCGGKPIFIKNVNTFEVTNCTIASGTQGGITVYGTADYPACNGTISYNQIDGRGVASNDGIGIHENDGDLADVGDNFIVSHNVIHGYAEQAIDINSGDYVTVSDNECYDNGDDGIIIVGFNQVVERNKIYDNGRDGIVVIGSVLNPAGTMEVSYNAIYNNARNGLLIYGNIDGVEVYNNTIMEKSGATGSGIRIGNDANSPVNITAKNNIITTVDNTVNHLVEITPDLTTNNIVFDHNSYWRTDGNNDRFNAGGSNYTFTTWQSAAGQDASGMFADPKLTSATDFHLTASSPCINAGEDVGLTRDYAGNTVPKCPNSNPDIGAYEYQYDCPTAAGGSLYRYSDPPIPGPNGFRCIINNNDAKTTSRNVTLTLEAGSNVRYVSVSEKQDLSDAGFEVFEPEIFTKPFNLSLGDGLKKVYAKFLTAYNRFSDIVYDEIILDTSSEQGNQQQTTQQQTTQQQKQQTLTSNLLRAISDTKVYQIINNLKHWVSSPEVFNSYGFDWQKIQEVSSTELDKYARAKLLRPEGDTKVYYLTEAGMVRHIPSPKVFNSYNNKWEDIITVSQTEIDSYPINNLIRLENGTKVFKLENHTKRWISTAEAFNRLKYDWTKIAPTNQTELDYYIEGKAIE